ncbi:hypothetical protein JDV02_005154 [Purpureocillium takamizusanense]|uniref:Prokaryotic-type class I peptide chain release factors domain-containing protein n=1 Tax=Purpureocillium takamizusanense TaxID=2060973 RepID=A0A9Q8VA23_9HYPO|nr:uncharacterized protein JDV02_005154 [Purpureocillium takamizusanense]UNI18920.1 hypothetical protein JDV02_005154 [Purpureocillium takamizusanense]
MRITRAHPSSTSLHNAPQCEEAPSNIDDPTTRRLASPPRQALPSNRTMPPLTSVSPSFTSTISRIAPHHHSTPARIAILSSLLGRRPHHHHHQRPRPLSTTTHLARTDLPARPKPPPDSEIEESFLKGSGPGGQKINKTNSAVQLKHIPTGIVVKSQATRSRSQNRKHARELLAQKVDDLLHGDQSRSAIIGEVKRKRAASAAKKSRRKYRRLQDDEEPSNAQGAVEPSVNVQREQDKQNTTQSIVVDLSSTSTSKDKP